MQDYMLEVLANVLGTTPGELTEALKEGEDFKSDTDIAEYLKKTLAESIDAGKRTVRDEHYGRGKRESLTGVEKALRAKHELTSSGSVDELIEELLEKTREGSKLEPDDVRGHDVYKADMQKLRDAMKVVEDTKAEMEKKYARREVLDKAKTKGDIFLSDHKFALPEDQGIKSNLMKLLYESLDNGSGSLKVTDDGDIHVMDAEGQRLQDANKVEPVTFESYFVNKAKNFFQIPESDDRKGPQNRNKPDPNKKDLPTGDKDKLYAQMLSEPDPAKKQILIEALKLPAKG